MPSLYINVLQESNIATSFASYIIYCDANLKTGGKCLQFAYNNIYNYQQVKFKIGIGSKVVLYICCM
jgi:hypothetical protein